MTQHIIDAMNTLGMTTDEQSKRLTLPVSHSTRVNAIGQTVNVMTFGKRWQNEWMEACTVAKDTGNNYVFVTIRRPINAYNTQDEKFTYSCKK
jgi:hypothetical protein